MATDLAQLHLIEGGPVQHLEQRMDRAHPTLARVRRATALALLAWAPQGLLSAAEGGALLSSWLRDFANHARFLGAVPLLVIAEVYIAARVSAASRRFGDDLVEPADRPRFEASVGRLNRLSASTAAEVALLLLAYALALARYEVLPQALHESWFATPAPSGVHLTAAGIWGLACGLPLLYFLGLRWLWRYGLWLAFLGRMSRLPLHLNPAHPDRNGGLGFLSEAQLPFTLLPLAVSLIIASTWARQIHWHGADLNAFKQPAMLLVAVVLLVFVTPLAVFAPRLWRLKIEGLYRFDTFSTRLARAFEDAWLVDRPAGPPLTPDIQSVADAGNSFAMAHSVRLVPIDRLLVIAFVAATAAPMAFPVVMSVPLTDLAKRLANALV